MWPAPLQSSLYPFSPKPGGRGGNWIWMEEVPYHALLAALAPPFFQWRVVIMSIVRWNLHPVMFDIDKCAFVHVCWWPWLESLSVGPLDRISVSIHMLTEARCAACCLSFYGQRTSCFPQRRLSKTYRHMLPTKIKLSEYHLDPAKDLYQLALHSVTWTNFARKSVTHGRIPRPPPPPSLAKPPIANIFSWENVPQVSIEEHCSSMRAPLRACGGLLFPQMVAFYSCKYSSTQISDKECCSMWRQPHEQLTSSWAHLPQADLQKKLRQGTPKTVRREATWAPERTNGERRHGPFLGKMNATEGQIRKHGAISVIACKATLHNIAPRTQRHLHTVGMYHSDGSFSFPVGFRDDVR